MKVENILHTATIVHNRVEKELEQFKDYDEKNFFADCYVSDECKNPDSYGIVCVKCGECGRTFTKDGILKENDSK